VKGDLRRITCGHIQDGLKLIAPGAKSGSIDLPDRIRLYKTSATLYIKKESAPLRQSPVGVPGRSPVKFNYRIPEPESDSVTVKIKEAGFNLTLQTAHPQTLSDVRKAGQWVAFFDKDAVKFPLVLRNYQPGDRFVPLGMTGRQKLKKYFIDRKVPRDQRASCPVLLSDDNVLWVVGHRVSENAKWQPSTRNVLQIACDLLRR
jgi:tRNA(Ile)-lysidine synthase